MCVHACICGIVLCMYVCMCAVSIVFLAALVGGGAANTITATNKPQLAIWSDSDDEGQYYTPPRQLQVEILLTFTVEPLCSGHFET